MGRLDRYGEPIDIDDTDDDQLEIHDPRCVRGWIGEDDEGRPRPCYHCRPHLIPEPPC